MLDLRRATRERPQRSRPLEPPRKAPSPIAPRPGWLRQVGNRSAQRSPLPDLAPALPTAFPAPHRIQRRCACGGDCASSQSQDEERLQTRLRVGPANDAFERQADQVADRFVAGSTGSGDLAAEAPAPPSGLQRQEEAPTSEPEIVPFLPEISLDLSAFLPEEAPASGGDGEPEIRTRPVSGASTPSAGGGADSGLISRALTGGRALPRSVRAPYESHLGADFRGVRIHTGSAADSACDALGARAFTLGRDVAFARGELRPGSRAGQHLLAHELTHVVQQQAIPRRVQRQKCCLPGSATPYVPSSSASFNCYAYVLGRPAAGILNPGQIATGRPFGGLNLFATSTYTQANVRRLTERDLGAAFGVNHCCGRTRRLIAEVVASNATRVARRRIGRRLVPVPMVGGNFWDFHWYRQDDDGYYSHKRGRGPTSRDDSAGNRIHHPAGASRSYSIVSYPHYVGTWCL